MRIGSPASLFVGRQRELDALQVQFAAAASRCGSLVLLTGEPGIGKTSVMRAFVASEQAREAVVLWGSCFEGDISLPFGPWVEALGTYARRTDAARLQEQLGPGAAPLAQLMPEIRAALPATPPAAPLDPAAARFRLYEAVVQLLLAMAGEHPVILVLDDLHWADADSLRLLRYVARFVAGARLLIVGLYRQMELDLEQAAAGRNIASALLLTDVLAMLRRETDYERITISGLSVSEVSEYLAMAATQHVPQVLVEAIYAETGGNPFYTREVFRHLLEQGRVLQSDGRWVTDLSSAALGIPDGVQRVLQHRMGLLSEETRRLLRLASACTSGFSFALPQVLGGFSDEQGLACIDEALCAGLIRSVGSTYDFAHAIVRHTLYDALNPDRRVRLHRQIAVALEQAYAGHELEHAAEIAAQYWASATLPGAAQGISYCLEAAEQARSGYAHERAVTFLRMARDLAPEDGAALRLDILRRLAIAEAEALRLADAQRTVQDVLDARQAEESTNGVEATASRAAFLATVGRALKDGGAPHAAWGPLIARGLALVGDRRDLTWARLMLLRDRFEPVSQGTITASRWLGYDPAAVAIARERGDEDDDAHTLEPFQWRSRQETDAILARARTWIRPTALMRALDVAARDLVFRHAAFADGEVAFEELLAAGRRYGSIPAQAEALVQLACCQATHGDLARARQTQQQAQDMVDRLGTEHRLRTIVSIMNGTLIAYYLDLEWSSLVAAATRFLAGAAVARTPHGLLAAAFLALAQTRVGNPADARATLAMLTPVLARSNPRNFMHNGAVGGAASAIWELGAVEFADAYEPMARALADAGVGGIYLSANELTIARMRALAGDMAAATDYFARARGVLDASGQRPLRAIVDYDEALALLRTGGMARPERVSRTTTLLDAALATFQVMGMDNWVARVHACHAMLENAHQAEGRTQSGFPGGLTVREVEVLRLIAAGKTNKEIAAELVISVYTAERHIANIYTKIDAHGRANATAYALSHDLIPLR